jgi:hypothetical protein
MKFITKDYTKRWLAKITNISERELYRILGYYTFPSSDKAKILAALLKVSIIDLWPPVIFDTVLAYRKEQQSIGTLYGITLSQAKRRVCFTLLMRKFGTEWTERYNMVADGLAIPNVREYAEIKALYTQKQQDVLETLIHRADFSYDMPISQEDQAIRSLRIHEIIQNECAEKGLDFQHWCEKAALDPVDVGQWIMGISMPNLAQERVLLKALGFDLYKLPQESYLWNRKESA